MVCDEADRTDEHVLDAACVEVVEVVEDVRAEPGLPRRRLALERERPVLDPGLLDDEPRRLEQLFFVRIAFVEDPFRKRMRGEDHVRLGAAHAFG